MIKTKSDSALDFWFDTDILFSEKLPQIEVKDADKLDRILWTFLPRKTQAQWTFVERDNPLWFRALSSLPVQSRCMSDA